VIFYGIGKNKTTIGGNPLLGHTLTPPPYGGGVNSIQLIIR